MDVLTPRHRPICMAVFMVSDVLISLNGFSLNMAVPRTLSRSRTYDLSLRRRLLYPLSYGGNMPIVER